MFSVVEDGVLAMLITVVLLVAPPPNVSCPVLLHAPLIEHVSMMVLDYAQTGHHRQPVTPLWWLHGGPPAVHAQCDYLAVKAAPSIV